MQQREAPIINELVRPDTLLDMSMIKPTQNDMQKYFTRRRHWGLLAPPLSPIVATLSSAFEKIAPAFDRIPKNNHSKICCGVFKENVPVVPPAYLTTD
ncbi:hypothetical protein HHI36_007136 [Cryptolaemus montrouzieri]|uniref:Uncharacterized protein n=1 Tax=Cryptolaemus montrouzieri TaxID=559131 RepID=A0ABD2MNU4_9CUCU